MHDFFAIFNHPFKMRLASKFALEKLEFNKIGFGDKLFLWNG